MLDAMAARAAAMHRSNLEARCRLSLAHLLVRERQYDAALAALDRIAAEGGGLAPELRAEWHDCRRQAMAGRGDGKSAEAEGAFAQRLITDLQASLPEQYRSSFGSRVAIRSLMQ
jgi:hypothetical protein